MPRRLLAAAGLALGLLMLAGCPKGSQDYHSARKAELIQDYDTALEHYERALKADPANTEYRLKATRIRFETALFHLRQGQKQRDKGELQLAVAEFEKAMAIDPSNAAAEQELRKTLEMLAAKPASPGGAAPSPGEPAKEIEKLLEKPPELRPVSREPINLKITNDARIVFETIAKLAGLAVIFDPDFQPRRITTELTNVTLEQALDVVALESKTFWKPVTSNIIFVVPEQAQKRKDYEDYVVRTFYLSNTVLPQDLTEVVAGLRQIADLRRIQQVTSQNAIVVRDTPDKIALIEKILRDIDRAKPEVVVQVSILEARTDRARDLGITPGSSSVLTFTPRNATSTTSGTTATTTTSLSLNKLQHLSSADYSITLPGASAMALLTDSTTKIIQNPEVRVVDGQSAKLRIGDRIPIATGSFQAGLGGAVGGTAAGAFVNPLVNTQFQYQDVGVNIDITPRVHLNHEVSMKISIEVSSVTGQVSIGGIQEPIFSQRKIEHDVRLKEGEVSVLAGLVQRTDTKTNTGWPGFAHIPFFHYFFSGEHNELSENEVLIVLTPRIVRLPELSAANLQSLSSGTESNIQVRKEASLAPPQTTPPSTPPGTPPTTQTPGAQPPAGQAPAEQPPAAIAQASRLRFDPQNVTIHPGETTTISLMIEDAKDLFSIPLLLGFNPTVVMVEDVLHGGFLSGGTKDVALVQRIDKDRGQAIISAARPPGAQGISGSGAIVMIVVRGVAVGASPLNVLQVNARDSQQKPIPLVSGEASIRVQ